MANDAVRTSHVVRRVENPRIRECLHKAQLKCARLTPGQSVGFAQPRSLQHLCPIDGCGKTFTKGKNLYRHYRTTNDPFYEKLAKNHGETRCYTCHMDFPRPTDRERHEKSHSILVKTGELDDPPVLRVGLNSVDPGEDLLISFCKHILWRKWK